jgi:hypothetical protein
MTPTPISPLLVAQHKFALMVAQLIQKAADMGYGVSLGEAYRTPEQAALNAQKGTGIVNSLHTQRLAIDLMLYRGPQYLTSSDDYKPLGIWWESIGGTWGGRFAKPDGDHFSLAWGGVN